VIQVEVFKEALKLVLWRRTTKEEEEIKLNFSPG